MSDRKKRSVSKRLGMLEYEMRELATVTLENRAMLDAVLKAIPTEEERVDIHRMAGEILKEMLKIDS